MHILIIPSWYKSIDQPLLGSFFEEQARALMKLGHTTGILFPGFYPFTTPKSKQQKFNYYRNDDGLQTICFNVSSVIPRWHSFNYNYFYKQSYKGFNDYVDRFGIPDLIHAHSVFDAALAAAYISRKTKIPFVITEHLTHYVTGRIRSQREFIAAVSNFKQADKAMVVSTAFKQELAAFLKMPEAGFSVMPNMVADLFFEDFKPKKSDEKEFVFITNSFLEERKNHKLLFDAVKILLSKNIKVKLKVGGDGIIRKQLQQYCLQIGIATQVEFLGPLSRKEVKQQIDASHAFVLTSTYETFGVVLIEALACGRPIISTDCKGPRDIVNPENGILLKSFEAEELATAMKSTIENYNQYDQNSIHENCMNRFSEKKVAGDLVFEYEVILKNRNLKISKTKAEQKFRQIIFSFDYELFLGNSSGSIKSCLIDPTNCILELLKKYGMSAIFFVDTTFLIKLREFAASNKLCEIDFKLINDQLCNIALQGHYLFPHIHPHWMDADYIAPSNSWHLGKSQRYKLADIEVQERNYLMQQSVELLQSVLKKSGSKKKVDGFRAGGWSVQPFEIVKPLFESYGIKYDFSVINKGYRFTDVQNFDYSNCPEKFIYSFEDDVCIEKKGGSFVEISSPAISIKPWLRLVHRVYDKGMRNLHIDSSEERGKGQIVTFDANKKPKNVKGLLIDDKQNTYLSIEGMSDVYQGIYSNYIKQNSFMHFASHPKMITNYHLTNFNKFLEFVFNRYGVETDFKRIIAQHDLSDIR